MRGLLASSQLLSYRLRLGLPVTIRLCQLKLLGSMFHIEFCTVCVALNLPSKPNYNINIVLADASKRITLGAIVLVDQYKIT